MSVLSFVCIGSEYYVLIATPNGFNIDPLGGRIGGYHLTIANVDRGMVVRATIVIRPENEVTGLCLGFGYFESHSGLCVCIVWESYSSSCHELHGKALNKS